MTVIRADDPYHHMSLQGMAASIDEDPDLLDIDRLSQHGFGGPYPQRQRRRERAWIDVGSWHGWAMSEAWAPSAA
jgi:hypothetical protein